MRNIKAWILSFFCCCFEGTSWITNAFSVVSRNSNAFNIALGLHNVPRASLLLYWVVPYIMLPKQVFICFEEYIMSFKVFNIVWGVHDISQAVLLMWWGIHNVHQAHIPGVAKLLDSPSHFSRLKFFREPQFKRYAKKVLKFVYRHFIYWIHINTPTKYMHWI